MLSLPSAPETKDYQPLISVIVPVYNVEQYLDKCLTSICKQTYRNLQIVCVNDGSTDGSARILAAWAAKDTRICVVTKENGGLSSARNAGLDVCLGEFVTGVDSDDWLLPDIYEKVVPHLTADCDMLAYTAQAVDESGNLFKDGEKAHFSLPKEGLYKVEWLWKNRINPCFWNKFWRRSIIAEHEIRFPDGLIHEDEVFIRMFTPFVRNFYSLPEIGYMYVQRSGSIMHSKRLLPQRAQINLDSAELMCRYNETHDVPPESWDNVLDFLSRGIPVRKGAVRAKATALLLNRMYGEFVRRHDLQHRFRGDYRLKHITSVIYGWGRFFVSRSTDYQTFKFCGIPLLQFQYFRGKRVAVKTLFSLFFCR